jgi:hypothetical protein
MTRQEANREILKLLTEANEKFSDQRFGQLLINAGLTQDFVDEGEYRHFIVSYHEESFDLLEKVKVAIRRIYGQN